MVWLLMASVLASVITAIVAPRVEAGVWYFEGTLYFISLLVNMCLFFGSIMIILGACTGTFMAPTPLNRLIALLMLITAGIGAYAGNYTRFDAKGKIKELESRMDLMSFAPSSEVRDLQMRVKDHKKELEWLRNRVSTFLPGDVVKTANDDLYEVKNRNNSGLVQLVDLYGKELILSEDVLTLATTQEYRQFQYLN